MSALTEQQRAKQQADYAEAVATVARLERKRIELEKVANAERERAAELEQQLAAVQAERADRHDDLAGALGYSGEDWGDLISIAAANTTQITRLGQQLACRSFYLAESEGAENGPTLHTTHVAAIAWCDEVKPGEWFEDENGVWVQCDTDPDTDRPTTQGAGTVTPLTAQGDGIVAEAERIRKELLAAGAKVPVLTKVRNSQQEEIRRLQTEQGEVMKALGCDRHDEWDEVLHRARQLAAGGGPAWPAL